MSKTAHEIIQKSLKFEARLAKIHRAIESEFIEPLQKRLIYEIFEKPMHARRHRRQRRLRRK